MKQRMTRGWRAGVALLLLSAGILIFWSVSTAAPGSMLDFEAVYYGSRCLLQHQDPYQESQLLRVFKAERGEIPPGEMGPTYVSAGVVKCINLPTSLFLLAPVTLLPWGVAHWLWMILTASSLSIAAGLIWRIAASQSPGLALFLTCFLLVNSKVVLSDGNTSGMAVGLCVIGACYILKERLVLVGIVCLAVSLMLKPQTTGGVWLFFLLAGGAFQKRALQTVALTLALCVPALVLVWQVSPQWMQELNSNLSSSAAQFGINDPGPDAVEGHSSLSIIDLRTVMSVFRNDPQVYNTATYLICGPLLLVWAVVTLRSRPSQAQACLGLAAIAVLTLLPVYHRMYDAKVLLLAVPACAQLAAEGGVTGRFALLLTTAGFVLTGDIPLAFLTGLTKNVHISMTGVGGKVLMVLVNRPVPLLLLLMGAFYLWVYAQRSRKPRRATHDEECRNETPA